MNNENLTNNLIRCSNCGAESQSNMNFCIKCGFSLHNDNREMVPNVIDEVNANQQISEPMQNEIVNQQIQELIQNQQPVQQSQTISNNNISESTNKMNYFKYLIGALLKPFNKYKEAEVNLTKFKDSAVISAILIISATLFNLISTMFNTVRVESFWGNKIEWVWENLREIEYLKVIGMDILLYSAIIFGITGVYFLASLVAKKESKFPRLLGASATAFIPIIISIIILSPILSLINPIVGLVVGIVGFIYALVILLELMNDNIAIENKNTKIYFHLICLSIIVLVLGFIAYKIVLGSLTSGLLGSLLG